MDTDLRKRTIQALQDGPGTACELALELNADLHIMRVTLCQLCNTKHVKRVGSLYNPVGSPFVLYASNISN